MSARNVLFRKNIGLNKQYMRRIIFEVSSVLLLLMNILLVVIAGLKYDVWSCFQSRLLFPSFFAIILLFNSGLNSIEKRSVFTQKIVYRLLTCLFSLFILYFLIEFLTTMGFLRHL